MSSKRDDSAFCENMSYPYQNICPETNLRRSNSDCLPFSTSYPHQDIGRIHSYDGFPSRERPNKYDIVHDERKLVYNPFQNEHSLHCEVPSGSHRQCGYELAPGYGSGCGSSADRRVCHEVVTSQCSQKCLCSSADPGGGNVNFYFEKLVFCHSPLTIWYEPKFLHFELTFNSCHDPFLYWVEVHCIKIMHRFVTLYVV